jgi:hypothetical protein
MLFLLVMEVLNALICRVNARSLFKPLGVCSTAYHVSFYADNLLWFISLEQQDIQMAHTILSLFEGSSSLGFALRREL